MTIMASTNSDEVSAVHVNDMNYLYILLCHTFKDYVVLYWLLEGYQVDCLSSARVDLIRKP